METHSIVIVGAGAAGLWAAITCAKRGGQVLLLEKTKRAGTKILASGGTRCNLTTTLDAEQAGRLFGTAGERFLRSAFRNLPPEAVVTSFEEWGVPCEEAPLEKIFPSSQKAKDVRDALLAVALEAGVEIRYEVRVAAISSDESGEGYTIVMEEGENLYARKLLLCPGGKSYPTTGTTGDGYAWLKALGLEQESTVPALVPLSSSEAWANELSGIAVQDAEVRLLDGEGKELMRRARPLLFTHKGLSGPGAMDVSGIVAEAQAAARFDDEQPQFTLAIDLCASLSREELRDQLVEASRASGSPRLSKALDSRYPRRIVDAVCTQAGVETNPPVSRITKSDRHKLVEAFKGLRVKIDGTLGFHMAEVTRGGLSLREVNPRNMELNRFPGLYVFGELLSIDGPIGGFNFQAAFATAELAAMHATKS
ncbi:MAG: putative Rossmann fold flavoprotein [Planctomycetota bacterium]|jgi:predicted Rossmann fold flavoprotein